MQLLLDDLPASAASVEQAVNATGADSIRVGGCNGSGAIHVATGQVDVPDVASDVEGAARAALQLLAHARADTWHDTERRTEIRLQIAHIDERQCAHRTSAQTNRQLAATLAADKRRLATLHQTSDRQRGEAATQQRAIVD